MSGAGEPTGRGTARIVFAGIGLLGGLICLGFAAFGISRSLSDSAEATEPSPADVSRAVGELPTMSDILNRMVPASDERTAARQTVDERTVDERTVDERTIDERTVDERSVADADSPAAPRPADPDAMRSELALAGLILRDQAEPPQPQPQPQDIIDPMQMLPHPPAGWQRRVITDDEAYRALRHELSYRQRAALIRSRGGTPPPTPPLKPRDPQATPPAKPTIDTRVLYAGPAGQLVLLRLSQTRPADAEDVATALAGVDFGSEVAFAGRSFLYLVPHEREVYTAIGLRFGRADHLSIDADVPLRMLGWLDAGLNLSRLPDAVAPDAL
ncbi:MAG: hypothetical protein AAFR46_15405 [Pseudomonadota bacterium]